MIKEKGYVIIIAMVILIAVLMIFVFTNFNKFLENLVILINLNSRIQAKSLAYACLEIALEKLKENQNYLGNETISVENLQCFIYPIEMTPNSFKIKAKSTINQINYFLFSEVDKASFSIINLEEKVSF
jgi:hypothetical protein